MCRNVRDACAIGIKRHIGLLSFSRLVQCLSVLILRALLAKSSFIDWGDSLTCPEWELDIIRELFCNLDTLSHFAYMLQQQVTCSEQILDTKNQTKQHLNPAQLLNWFISRLEMSQINIGSLATFSSSVTEMRPALDLSQHSVPLYQK